MKRFFITGTDTDVGKTTICAWLTAQLHFDWWKPVQTGLPPECDTAKMKVLMENTKGMFIPPAYHFQAPLSPHHAAFLEKKTIDITKICSIPQTKNSLLIEGAGGVLVPIQGSFLMIDLIKSFNIPALVVARSELGTINHTCLTIEALKKRGINIAGIIMNGPSRPHNKEAIEHYSSTKVLAECLPFPSWDWKSFTERPLPNSLQEVLL